MGIDGAVAGGIIAVVLALIKVIDILVRNRNRKNHLFSDGFTAVDRGTANDSHMILARTGPEGEYLVYGVGHLQKAIESQTVILSAIQKLLMEQASEILRRIDICDKHADILGRLAAKENRR